MENLAQMTLEEYCEEIKECFIKRGILDQPEYDPEVWRDSFENGDSPMDAVDTELSYWD